jgi:DNA-binding XRE family transcriptional regulator
MVHVPCCLILEFITLFVNIYHPLLYNFFEVNVMKYNERIRELREDNSLTQQKIADILHVGQRTYSDYESGKTRIPIDNIMILAKFYDVSMDFITGVSNIKNKYPKK